MVNVCDDHVPTGSGHPPPPKRHTAGEIPGVAWWRGVASSLSLGVGGLSMGSMSSMAVSGPMRPTIAGPLPTTAKEAIQLFSHVVVDYVLPILLPAAWQRPLLPLAVIYTSTAAATCARAPSTSLTLSTTRPYPAANHSNHPVCQPTTHHQRHNHPLISPLPTLHTSRQPGNVLCEPLRLTATFTHDLSAGAGPFLLKSKSHAADSRRHR